jgi:outer membrane protein OmpA-like peptidoglycan-associated protein
MASIVDALRESVSREVLSALSRQTGESEAALSNGFTAAVPTIAAAIANRCDDRRFVMDVAAVCRRAAADPNFLTTAAPGQWLSMLFGSNLPGVTDGIARYAGLHESAAASLLLVSGRLVLGCFGRLMREDRLNAGGFATRLCEERAQIGSALPSSFQVPELPHSPVKPARAAVDGPTVPRRARLRRAPMTSDWTGPLLALVALGVGGMIGWVLHQAPEQGQVEFGEPMAKAVGTAGTITGRFTRALPGNVIITILPGSAEDRLSMYLASNRNAETTINLDRIAFENSSAELTPASRDQIDNVATILRAYPTASVTIAGYTDNLGAEDKNLQLSRARAEAVATRLIAAGVLSDRVRAEGHGSQSPVADNATEAGRMQNQRIALEIIVR